MATLVTRCPQCQTAFRVVADQLRLRGGKVRCGVCQAVFDGRKHQLGPESGTPIEPFIGDGQGGQVPPAAPGPRVRAFTAPAGEAAPAAPDPAVAAPAWPPAPVRGPGILPRPTRPGLSAATARGGASPAPAGHEGAGAPHVPDHHEAVPTAAPRPSPAAGTAPPSPPQPAVTASRPTAPAAPTTAEPYLTATRTDAAPRGAAPVRTEPRITGAAPAAAHEAASPAARAAAEEGFVAARAVAVPAVPPVRRRREAGHDTRTEPVIGGEVAPDERRDARPYVDERGDAHPYVGRSDDEPTDFDDGPGLREPRVETLREPRHEPDADEPPFDEPQHTDEPPPHRRDAADLEPEPEEFVADGGHVRGRGLDIPVLRARSGIMRVVWATGLLLALVALAGQALWWWRTPIATHVPALRPLLESACASFGCRVGYERAPSRLTIESSSVQPAAGAQAEAGVQRLALQAVLRNRAEHPQPWPTLELTLTDYSDTVVVRRAVPPEAYLGALAAGRPFAANSEQTIAVALTARGVPISGYRLALFFP